MTGRSSAALVAYRVATTLAGPAAPLLLDWRARRGKEDPARLGERRGIASRPRPEGPVIWAHGASIGETLSLLPLVEAMVARGLKVLVTSGTVTSADILARRLPPGARHQFAPLDVPAFAARFLDHWRPSLALFAESELWPNAIVELDRRGIPLVLVNGRVSARSFGRWRRASSFIGSLLERFAICLAQSGPDADRLAQLGAPITEMVGNLKFDIAPPPADPLQAERLAGTVAGRPVWMAASTHPGEDDLVVQAHRALRERFPTLLTIVAPRHPARGRDVALYARTAGLAANLRSEGGGPDVGDIHVADTVGDLGLYYRVAPLVFMGGSLVPHGGQNPIEPARLGAAILHGPHVANFAEVYAALDARRGALRIGDKDGLVTAASDLLGKPSLMREVAREAAATVAGFGGARERTMRAIEPFLPPAADPAGALW